MLLKNIFTLLIIFFPVLYIYSLPSTTITYADALLLILIPFLIVGLKKKNKLKINKFITIVILYTTLQLCILTIICSTEYINEIFFSTVRLVIYYLTLGMFIPEYFDVKLGKKLYKYVAIFSASYLIIQLILWNFFNIFLPGTIPGLKIATELEKYNIIMKNHSSLSAAYSRPRSIFFEPSHVCIYIALQLAISLIIEKEKDIKTILLITVALLLSGSGTGIILCFIIYCLYIFKYFKNINKKFLLIGLIALLMLIIILPIYFQTESFQIFYDRTFKNGDSTSGRFGNYEKIFTEDINLGAFLFGRGMYTKMEDYIPSVPRIYYYYGFIGTISYIYLTIYCFTNLKGIRWITWTLLFVIAFESEILFHSMLFIYAPFIIKEK